VRTLVPLVGFALHAGVTPAGRPETERLTLSVKPFRTMTLMVVLLEVPGVIVKLLSEEES
jgi:hypothetical protein